MDKLQSNPDRPLSKPSVPHSGATVNVAIIDTTTRMGNVRTSYLAPASHYPSLSSPGDPTPSYSILITHSPSKTRVLFDLGLRTDWKAASSPAILRWISSGNMSIEVEKDVATILKEGGVQPDEVGAVIFSHQHFDHTGDTNRFSKDMKIVVGPGYVERYLPGWPEDRKGWETTSDLYNGREVVEIPFSEPETNGRALMIGDLHAYDYFGDGSLYLLSTPGHTVGHISALARTTAPVEGGTHTAESTFIFLGGDVAHNCALFRPSHLGRLPDMIHTASRDAISQPPLDGDRIASFHRSYDEVNGKQKARMTPFCTAAGAHHSVDAAQRSLDALSMLDGLSNVFTVLAHDTTLEGVVELFPRSANNWKKKGWKEKCRWTFLERLVGETLRKDSKI